MVEHMVGATTDGPKASQFEQGVEAKTWLAVSNVVRKNLCEESEGSVCDAWRSTLLSFEKMTASPHRVCITSQFRPSDLI